MNKHARQASAGKYRITGYDQYDYTDYFVDEFENLNEALAVLERKRAVANGSPSSFSDIYFIYDDQAQLLYRGTYDEGISKSA